MRDNTVPAPERRHLFKQVAAGALGALLALPALIGGALTLLHPLRRRGSTNGGFIRVTSLTALPADGVPRRFPVFADATDAWTRSPNVRAASVMSVSVAVLGSPSTAAIAAKLIEGVSTDFDATSGVMRFVAGMLVRARFTSSTMRPVSSLIAGASEKAAACFVNWEIVRCS